MVNLKIGDKIQLKGKSLKGKNRVNEHGDIWVVIKGPALTDDGFILAGQICIEPFPVGSDIRWIMPVNDRNFEILDKLA